MKRECKSPALKFVFKNLPVIWEELKLLQTPWVSKDKGICTPLPGKKHFIVTMKNTGWRPAPNPELSAFLPALLNPQIKPLLQHAFYLSSTTLCMRENLYSVSTHF